LDELECVLTDPFSVANGDVERGHFSSVVVAGGVRSVRSRRTAADGLPVLVCARPDVDETSFDVCVLEDRLFGYLLCVGKTPNIIRPAGVR
jgi:hypothetical protein